MAAVTTRRSSSDLASGAYPATTFPNTHLMRPISLAEQPPAKRARRSLHQSPIVEKLAAAVQSEDWERNFSDGLTLIPMRGEWSAGPQRRDMLHHLVTKSGASRVLEIGSFCGVSSLVLAEALPAGGEVLALEMDPYSVQLGKRFHRCSPCGQKIKTAVGPAADSLRQIAKHAGGGCLRPFDLVLVDADKDGMQDYFDFLWSKPGLLSDHAIVCVDLTPFKGQPPLRYTKYGFPYRWRSSSGDQDIEALRAEVLNSPQFEAYEAAGLLIVKRACST